MNELEKKEYSFINVSKFFAMIHVVILHTIMDNRNPIFKIVQVGVMAYFFFASGFLFDSDINILSLRKTFLKNTKKLIIPYLSLSLIGMYVCYYFPNWYGEYKFEDYIKSIFFIGQPLGYGLLWFLICLFFVKTGFLIIWCIVNLISDIFYKLFSVNKKIISSILLIMVLITIIILDGRLYQYLRIELYTRLPLKIDSACIAIIFYIIGFLTKYLDLYKAFTNRIICIFILIIMRYLANFIEMNYIVVNNICDFLFEDSFYMYLINQIIMIIGFTALGNIFRDVKLFNYIGKNNIYMYLIHIFVLWYVEYIYCIVNNIENNYQFYDLATIVPISIIAYIVSLIIQEIIIRITKVN